MMDDLRTEIDWFRLHGAPRLGHMGTASNVPIHSDRIYPLWVLGIITRGQMAAQIGECRSIIGTGEYYLMPPNIRHFGTKPIAHDVFYFTFHMEGEPCAAPESCDLCLPVFGVMPPEFNYRRLHTFMEEGQKFRQLSPAGLDAQLKAILWQMAMEAQRRREHNTPSRRLAGEILRYLDENLTRTIHSRELVKVFGYSYGHLDRVFRQRFGESILHRHTELRMRRAVEMLLTGASIKEAARCIGYDDYYYFLRTFKRTLHTTPTKILSTGTHPSSVPQ